jgi:hypothetical protein
MMHRRVRQCLSHLTCQRASGGLRWWPRGGAFLNHRAQEILRGLDAPAGADVEALKQYTRRCVLRVRNVFPFGDSVVVKGFPLARIESRLKYRKYGLTEFCNYQGAAERNIPAPACHGYFEVRSFGMVVANGIVIEDLGGWRSLAELASQDAPGHALALSAAIPLLKLLYETGTNHVDASPQNMLLSPDGGRVRLIDWQYCSFVAPRNDLQLALQAAYFLSNARVDACSPLASGWLHQLVLACAPAITDAELRAAAGALQARGKISAEDRLCLQPEIFPADFPGRNRLPRQSRNP